MHFSKSVFFEQPDLIDDIFCSRAFLRAVTIASMFDDVASNADLRIVSISSRDLDIKFVQPVARLLHDAKNLSKSLSSEHFEKSLSHLSAAVKHVEISFEHVVALLLFVAAFFCKRAISLLIPAAVHDFSINGSYASETSSSVQFCIFSRHNFVAQT